MREESAWDKFLGLTETVVVDWFGEWLMRILVFGLIAFLWLMIPAFFLALFFLIN